MRFIHKHVRIEPAFEDREEIREMFARHAPYRAIAAYIPDAVVADATKPEADQFVQPWFRGNWAAGGESLVEGAEAVLHNKQFLEAAKTVFGTSSVFPEFVVVNVNAPMPAGVIHVDVPALSWRNAQAVSLAVSARDGELRSLRKMARDPGWSGRVVL